MPADCGEWILLFDQRQRVPVLALGCLLQIPLYSDVRRTGGLAWGRPGIIAIDPVLIPVILIPLFRSPFCAVRKFMLRIGYGTVLGAQLLSQLDRACRTILHAAPAGYAVLRLHSCHIGRAGHIGGVKQLGGPKGIADIHIAVTDGKYLVLAVNVGNLMHEPVILRTLKNLHHFVVCNISSTLIRLHHIVRHISYRDAPVFGIIGAAFIISLAGHSAGAGACGVFAIIFLKPVGDMLDINGLILHLNGFLHWYDMHADACASRRNHRGYLLQRKPGHPLEEPAQFRMLFKLLLIHISEFRAAWHEHGKHILLLPLWILPVVFDKPYPAHFIQQFLKLLFLFPRNLQHLLKRHRLSHLHL